MSRVLSPRAYLKRVDQDVRANSFQAVAETGQFVRGLHQRVVRDWTHRPSFQSTMQVSKLFIRAVIKPVGEHAMLWVWVDKGTEGPYEIKAKGKKPLRFQTGYSPRTMPIAKSGVGSGSASGEWVSKRSVTHPGITARKFSEKIIEEARVEFLRNVQSAVHRAIAR